MINLCVLTTKKDCKEIEMNNEMRKKTLTLKTKFKRRTLGNVKGNSITVIKKIPKVSKKVQAQVLPKKATVKKKPKKLVIEKLPLEEAIVEIGKYWPRLFPNGKLVPMEVGIKKRLKADCRERALPIDFERVEACLGGISSSLAYHELIIQGGERYNKDGQAVAAVSKESVAYSKSEIEKIKMKLKKT